MQKYSRELWVGVFVLICLLCVGYLTVKLGKLDIFGSNTYAVTAKFSSVSGLRTGAAVEIAGVEVGKVASIRLNPEFGVAVVSLEIKKDVPLSEDVIASVKTSGLIGDKYIKLTPGGAPEVLADGGTITETESAVDLEELISKYVFGDV